MKNHCAIGIGAQQMRTVGTSSVGLSISRDDLKKGAYRNAHVTNSPDMLFDDLPHKALTKEQALAVAKFLYDVLSVKENENG